MASCKVIHHDSALSENSKDTSERIPIEKRVEVVNNYTKKLANSGLSRVRPGWSSW